MICLVPTLQGDTEQFSVEQLWVKAFKECLFSIQYLYMCLFVAGACSCEATGECV